MEKSKFHTLLFFISSQVIASIIKDENIQPLEAIEKFYLSQTYHTLEQEDTGYWMYSPAGIFLDYKEEMAHG
jgi:hypothetical protein